MTRLRQSSVATAAGLAVHYLVSYLLGAPLWTEVIAEWIMARTPSRYALWILDTFGAWAKPFAMTGGLAALGFLVLLVALWRPLWTVVPAALAAGWLFGYHSWAGQLSFWAPALLVLVEFERKPAAAGRRLFLTQSVMAGATVGVALESYLRDKRLAARVVQPVDLFPFAPPADRAAFGGGLVRKAVTPLEEFYGMSKNTVDPAIDPRRWRVSITVDGQLRCTVSYGELLNLPRLNRYVTLRCISNTLESNLTGTALWTGFLLRDLVDRQSLPAGIREVAFIGVDGHGDSLPLDYAYSEESLLAMGMNGNTLNRTHGFPFRLLCPRYYGFKNVKWIGEIALVSKPYIGTWPKMGYKKEALIHTATNIDRVLAESGKVKFGGVSFAGNRGIQRVEIRGDGGPWLEAALEPPLSPYTWTRWHGVVPVERLKVIEARAQDGTGAWQADVESPLFPDGVAGPTLKKVSS